MSTARGERRSWDWGALLVRIALGAVFILHGSQKVFGAFGGPGPAGFTAFVGRLGLPLAPVASAMAMFAELGGGLMVLLGLATEVGAFLIAANMVVAITLVILPRGLIGQNGLPSFEFEWVLLMVAAALIVGGPGRFALWDPFRRRRWGWR